VVLKEDRLPGAFTIGSLVVIDESLRDETWRGLVCYDSYSKPSRSGIFQEVKLLH
jgi:hypothetical protein